MGGRRDIANYGERTHHRSRKKMKSGKGESSTGKDNLAKHKGTEIPSVRRDRQATVPGWVKGRRA